MTAASKTATLVFAPNPTSPPFPDKLAFGFNRESGRYELRMFNDDGSIGDPVLEIEPSGGGKFNLNPRANPGASWATTDG